MTEVIDLDLLAAGTSDEHPGGQACLAHCSTLRAFPAFPAAHK